MFLLSSDSCLICFNTGKCVYLSKNVTMIGKKTIVIDIYASIKLLFLTDVLTQVKKVVF